jgi:hypothetical protein
MCTPNVSKNDDDNGNGKRLGAFFVSTAFCATLSEVGGDLLFAAQITAGIILGNLQYAATLV